MLDRQVIDRILTKSACEEQFRAFHRATATPGGIVEVRIPKPFDRWRGAVSGYFDSEDALVAAVLPYVTKPQAAGVYATINQVNPALFARAPNVLLDRAEHTTTDKDILRRRFLFVDIDPVRPVGISATREERTAALDATDAVVAYLTDLGWPAPAIVGSSGNGGAIFYRVDLPNTLESTQLVSRVLKRLASLFDSEAATIDTSVSNAARIVKLPGTAAAKGRQTVDRPWRFAIMTTNPDAGVVDVEQLDAFTDLGDDDPSEPMESEGSPNKASSTGAGADTGSAQDEPSRTGELDVAAVLKARGIGFTHKKTPYGDVWVLDACLTSGDHDDGACIIRLASGALAYRCQHTSCKGKSWADAKAALGLPSRTTSGKSGPGDRRGPRILTEEEYLRRPLPEQQITGVIQVGSFAMLVADFGSFKTFVALAMAKCVAHGLAWMGYPTRKGVALYIAGEGGTAIQKRLRAFSKHHGVGTSPDFFMLPEAIAMIDDGQVDGLIQAIRALPAVPTFIVLDTVARTFGPGNENAQEDMGRYVDAVGRLQAEFGATVLVVHHVNKQGEYRRSTALPGAVDTKIDLDPTKDGVKLRCTKQKDFEAFRPIFLQKVVVPLEDGPVTDDTVADPDRLTSLVFVTAGTEPGGEDATFSHLSQSERAMLTALVLANAADGPVRTTHWFKTVVGVPEGTLYRVRPTLVDSGYVATTQQGNSTFNTITTEGRRVLEPLPNPFGTEASDAT